MDYVVNVIGAGLAGCEATYQLIKRGIKVRLYEIISYFPLVHQEILGSLFGLNIADEVFGDIIIDNDNNFYYEDYYIDEYEKGSGSKRGSR